MSGRSELLLRDMLRYAGLAIEFAAGKSEDDLGRDEMFQLAVVHAIQTIGEAAKGVPDDVRQLNMDIPWGQIAQTRNILVHHYFGVKLDLVWQLLQKQLPELVFQLNLLLERMKKQ